MNISEHITLHEATFSQTAARHKWENQPTDEVLRAMQAVAINCFEPVMEWYGKPLRVSSFYRSPKLNVMIGGSINSQHVKGEAIDFSAPTKEENERIFEWMKTNIVFDQLINEYDFRWIHVSFTTTRPNRKQILKIPK